MTAHAGRARWTGGHPDAAAAGLGLGVAVTAAAAAVMLGPAALALPAALVACVFLVREPLALLVLYLWIGLFKQQPIVEAVPGDTTVLLGGLLAAVCFARLVQGRMRSVPYPLALTLVVMGAALIAGLSWTPALGYGGDKAWRFLTLTLLAVLAPFCLIENQRDVRRYLRWTVIAAAVVALSALAGGPAEGRLELGSGDTISTSLLLCAAALVLLLMGLAQPAARLWATAAGIGLIVVGAQVGSRGPIIGLGLSLLIVAALWVMRVPRKMLPLLVAVVAGVAVFPFISLPEGSSARLSAVTRDPIGTVERDQRAELYSGAVTLIERHPLRGAGTGAFATVAPPTKWPHNVFLELWSELGVIPALALAACVVALLASLFGLAWRLPEGRPRLLVYIIIGLFLSFFFAVQVTGDLNENRVFWSVFGLAWLVARHDVLREGPGLR
jgi:O-antigen ligase